MQPVPIFLLCHNNFSELRLCIKSIVSRTKYPHQIVVVDNASTDQKMIDYLEYIKLKQNIIIHKNKYNLWLLGLNSPIKKILKSQNKFLVISDSDIIVPLIKNGICWLTSLINELDKSKNIGKLGLSLDLGYLIQKSFLFDTFKNEIQHYNNLIIKNNYIGPTDTTLAIYRDDYFITKKFQLFPGHKFLKKKEYLDCRTNPSFRCKHIGWRSYNKKNNSDISKVICFTLTGAYCDKPYLSKLNFKYQFFYYSFRPIFRFLWGMHIVSLLIFYYFKDFWAKVSYYLNNKGIGK